ncbi:MULTISPECIES: molybdopterin-containing oxidoreductase family protein [Mycobacterium]|uniref:molybdopterin-containing oxidoreductase family protein n=1 Tax=Mycobacterium TaxID=1763 RepID=UPI000AE34C5A|nr:MULTISPECIES: molybdopterin-dependent oxidoreductase [Mycobacterium]MCG7606682.1 molybdopterin-dependent oxidoreductase [Mycobacterium sp. CnD-18-1]
MTWTTGPGPSATTTRGAVRTVKSFCRICTSVCGILVEVEGDTVTRVRGDRDHPLSKGYACPKGRALPQMHHHPDRIERPQLRIDGRLQDTSWTRCLDDLGTRLKGIIDRHGPASVGIFFGTGVGMDATGTRVAEALHAAIGTPARFSPLTIDGTAKPLISDLVGGFVGLSGRPDYDNVDFMVFIGTNPVISHGHAIAVPNPTGTVRGIADRGQVWVIDPRRTETARLATGHLAPRPGTDHAVLAYLVREILLRGVDPDVPVQDCDRLTAAVEPFTLERTAELSDLAPEQLRGFRDAVLASRRIAIETGTGVTMTADKANVTQWLAWVLMILTGSMNRPGGFWFHPGFSYQLETFELPISAADGSFGPGPRSRPETQSFMNEWPCATLPDEIEAGNIRALINLGGSLLTSFPNSTALRPALAKLEVLATTEIIANETVAMSTHVLPTKDQLERPDITIWDALSSRVSAQHTPAVVPAVGDRRSMWWFLAELGRRLGHEIADPRQPDDTVLAGLTAAARCDFEELTATGWMDAGHELPAPWVERHIERMGGWRVAPQILVDRLADLKDTAALVLIPRRQMRRLNAQLDFLGDAADVLINPDDGAAAGVADGAAVTVRNAHGEMTGRAKLDPGIRRGAVSVPHGHVEANVNELTDRDDVDLVTGMVRYSGVPVSLHPAR